MKRWKSGLTALLLMITLATPAAAHPHAGDPMPTVSPWAQEEVARAQELGLMGLRPGELIAAADGYSSENYQAPITRITFQRMAMEYISLQVHCDSVSLRGMTSLYIADQDADGNPKRVFTDGSGEEDSAYYLGVVQGRGDGTFDPEGLITRQEAAVMLTRAYVACGGTLLEERAKADFSDAAQIAAWAQESAAVLADWDVMRGLDDGSFSPEGQYTVEQCIVTFLRLCENAPAGGGQGNPASLFSYEQGADYVKGLLKGAEETGVGYSEAVRVEGAAATFVRLDWGGAMRATSRILFLYRSGGVREFDLGVCNTGYGPVSPGLAIDNPAFSEDGKTFTCSITIVNPEVTFDEGWVGTEEDRLAALTHAHEDGVYRITVDVETCRYELQYAPLPGEPA